MSQPLTSAARTKIAGALAKSHTIPETAEIAGCSEASVSRYKKDPKVREKASYHKLSKGIKQSLGILPSPTPSIFIQSIYNDNRGQVLADNVLQLISQGTSQQSTVDNLEAFDMLTDDTTIDADLVDNS